MPKELKKKGHGFIDHAETEMLQIGRDLHDGPIQELYSLFYHLEELRSTSESISTDTLTELSDHIIQVISQLRTISSGLRPPALATLGLEKAIRSHIQMIQETLPHLAVHLHLAPDGQQISMHQRLSLFRVYQHAVTNVVRHARATSLWVRLDLDSQQVYMEVSDDGQGFTQPEDWIDLAVQGHFGLIGTIERVEAMGGSLDIRSSPGKGTRISVKVPLATNGSHGTFS